MFIFIFIVYLFAAPFISMAQEEKRTTFWEVQSIDTMKYSRDLSREKLFDRSFDAVINQQIKAIAETGATHVAIGTPYDAEFLPYLKRWVAAARASDLNVWFRGNWSGWEGWFDYPIISRADHIDLTEKFILNNKNLFEDGDIFTACPECENGGPGDPRHNGDVAGHRQFLINEYNKAQAAFEKINKDVKANYFSMNGDVARLVMNKSTTESLGSIVTIDHYVRTVQKLASDIKNFAEKSGGEIVLGEFGAPIPDIHGRLSKASQAAWIENALEELVKIEELKGINYWTNIGGSTQLWNEKGMPTPAVEVIRSFYKPLLISGFVKDKLDRPIAGAVVKNNYRSATTRSNGYFELPYLKNDSLLQLSVSAEGYLGEVLSVATQNQQVEITLVKQGGNFVYYLLSFIKMIFSFRN